MEPTSSDNPLLAWGTLPRFGEIEPHHVAPAVQQTLALSTSALSRVEREAHALDARELVDRLEPIDDRLGWLWTLVNHLNSVKTCNELREVLAQVQPEVVAFTSRMAQSAPLFAAFERLAAAPDFQTLPPAYKRVIEGRLLDAKHAGVGLEGEARETFNANKQELAQLSLDYGNNVLDATKAFELMLVDPADVAGLPESALALAAQSARSAGQEAATSSDGPWRVTLDYPSFFPFMKYSERRELRERIYRAFVTRASSGELDNLPLVERVLELRAKQAALLGYPSYAGLSIDAKMAPDTDAVDTLLSELHAASYVAAQGELAELEAFARDEGGPDRLALWDVHYWARRLRQARFQYSEEDLRPYFALPRVLKGLFALVQRLFEISVVEQQGVQTWHDDVRYFEVRDASGSPIAGFFLDPYSRPAEKRGGAWMNECLGRSRIMAAGEQAVRKPVAYLVCNQSPPVDDTPSLMTFAEVNTLFHEFGHGLHHMLTQVDVGAVSGISGVEWDAVELPSQFMENWATHRPTLLGLAQHWQTGEPLPDELADKVIAAKTFHSGRAFLRQLYFARLDLTLHHDYQPGGDDNVLDVQREVARHNTLIAPLQEDRFLCAFGHLFAGGYAAGYYSYKWAEVLSADAFAAFEEAGLDDDEAVAATGRRFRDTVLALGGSVAPMEIFRRFRGREPSTEPLLRHHGLA